jgi:glutamate---cysteine ligase / carboxylate-amine ligase
VTVPPVITVGVEEEFLLVDRVTGHVVPAAVEVGKVAREDLGDAVHTELQQTQIEFACPPCATIAELHEVLTFGRDRMAAAAGSFGLWLVPSGTPPAGGASIVSSGARFAGIAARYAELMRDYQACGCHVHAAVPDEESAVAVVNHLRPWLPTLLSLSANSPFHHGRDTGYASWRMIEQSRFPGAGIPPWFRDAADYAARVDTLVDCGVLEDATMTFWLARPSPRWPTVEFRVADAAVDVPAALLQAALSRALVATALTDLARGREAPRPDDQVLAAALWSSARHGLCGDGVHPLRGSRTPATELVDELLARVTPALEELGDLATVRELLAGVMRGTGAQRQRAAGEPLDVVRSLAIGVSTAY